MVAEELSAKIEQTICCDLEPRRRKMYDDLRQHYRSLLLSKISSEGIAKSKIQVLEALLRLHLTSRMESRKRPSGPFQMAIEPGAFGKSHQSPAASPS